MKDFFNGYAQYINWRLKPKAKGDFDKIPIGSIKDPTTWKTYAQAVATGERIGFVFTKNDPFFFLDIDKAVDNSGNWSPIARQLCEVFCDCAVEISHSDKGLHIFGTGEPKEAYKNKNREYNIEFYFQDRFVALTGNSARGSAFSDARDRLDWLINAYFQPKNGQEPETTWTTSGERGWDGPKDDAELLKIAMNSRSIASSFGDGISFSELYNADADALRRRFPATNNHGFDWSAADMALLSHLAFYTGKNHERMERIFGGSALANREKWQNRQNYRERSILRAASACSSVYFKSRPNATVESDTGATLRAGSQFLDPDAQLRLFDGCVYVQASHQVFAPGYGLLQPKQFRAIFGGYQFMIAWEGRPVTDAFTAFTENRVYHFPIAHGLCFRPELKSGAIIHEEGRSLLNSYEPVVIKEENRDVSRFLDLLKKLLPNDNDRTILLSYMAACVQNIGVKFQWAPVIQGVAGNGKTFLSTAIIRTLGLRHCYTPSAGDLSGNGLKFTGWAYGKLFIAIEEIMAAGEKKVREELKRLITNLIIEFQFKGKDQFIGDNRANFMFFSNHKDALKITAKSRRYCALFTAQQLVEDLARDGMAGRYFPDLYDWANGGGWAAIAYYLRRFEIPEELNPAGLCHRAPKTTSFYEACTASLDPAEQEILEAVAEGRIGFRGGWISSIAVGKLLNEKRYMVAPNKRRAMLENLGFVMKCRLDDPSPVDGFKKPVLYIDKNKTDLLNIKRGKDIAARYQKAQTESACQSNVRELKPRLNPY